MKSRFFSKIYATLTVDIHTGCPLYYVVQKRWPTLKLG